MKEAALLLDLPAPRAVRWLALHWLGEAAAAHARLGEPEALHDFRVAIRRLRSTLEAYRREVPALVRRGDRRRLRRLARATGGARDAEVQLAWLRGRRPAARGDERAGVDWSRQRLEARALKAGSRLEEAAAGFPRLAARLRRRLGRYASEVGEDDPRELPPFRTLLARGVAGGADALEEALAAVSDETRQAEAHRARIAAKRLRYLLEPAAGAVDGAAEAVQGLRALQDALGAMHDLDLLWTGARSALREDEQHPPAGAEALMTRVGRERRERFAEVRRGWLEGAAAPLLETVREVAARLAGPPADREVERKYLLRRLPALRGLPVEVYRLDQGYLPGERLAERVRRERGPHGVRYTRTLKAGSGVSRLEVEEACSEPVFRALWRLTRGRRVRKVRFRVAAEGRVWEIDRFRDRPLVLAEVELADECEAVTLPAWLAPVVEREVTGEAEYVNLNLAR